LLGYGIGHIKSSIPAWRFEFIIIGALCFAWGIVIMVFMPDSPVTAKFLTDHEKRVIVLRLKDNQTGVENKQLKPYQILEAFKDPKLYLFYVLGTVCNLPNGGISNFGTLIVQGIVSTVLNRPGTSVPKPSLKIRVIRSCITLKP